MGGRSPIPARTNRTPRFTLCKSKSSGGERRVAFPQLCEVSGLFFVHKRSPSCVVRKLLFQFTTTVWKSRCVAYRLFFFSRACLNILVVAFCLLACQIKSNESESEKKVMPTWTFSWIRIYIYIFLLVRPEWKYLYFLLLCVPLDISTLGLLPFTPASSRSAFNCGINAASVSFPLRLHRM